MIDELQQTLKIHLQKYLIFFGKIMQNWIG